VETLYNLLNKENPVHLRVRQWPMEISVNKDCGISHHFFFIVSQSDDITTAQV